MGVDSARSAPQRRQRPVLAGAWLAALSLLLGAYCVSHFKVSTDITHFLPDGEGAWGAHVLKALSTSQLSQRMVLTLSGADEPVLARASEAFAKRLSAHSEVRRVQRGVDEAAQRATFELYFPRRYALWSTTPEVDYRALLSDAGLTRAASTLLGELGGVQGPLVRRLAPEDPLLAFERLRDRLAGAREGGLTLRDGVFFSADGKRAVLFLETRAAALDATKQRRVLNHIAHDFEGLKQAHGQGLLLEMSGVGRYAVQAEESIRTDVQRISVVSMIAVLLLFAVVFGSPRGMLLVALPPLMGILVAIATTLAWYGRVHGATLAFGATLIGVCEDYPVHLLGHHALGPRGRTAHATLREIWPAILLGGLTTVAGLAGLGWANFPGIREMAWFTSVGVVTALVVTRFVIPHWVGRGGSSSAMQRRLASSLGRVMTHLGAHPSLCVALLIAALALCVAGLPRMRFSDDLANWVPDAAALRAEDARVQKSLHAPDPGRIVLTTAASEQAALAANDAVAALLAQAVRARELGGFRSLHALLWSEALQRRNLQALHKADALPERFARAFDTAGFVPDAFAPFFATIKRPVEPLRLQELLESPLGPAVSAFVLRLDGKPTFMTYLEDVRDPVALAHRIARVKGARFFDQRVFLTSTYARFRARTAELVAVGVLAVFLIVFARYRAVRPSLAAIVPAVLAAGGALSLLSLLGVTLDLFHVVGLLVVLSMGVDYGVFLVESRDANSLQASALSVVLGCVTTVLSFGLLAMSAVPALRSLGQVISVGLLLALLWSPAALFVLDAKGRS